MITLQVTEKYSNSNVLQAALPWHLPRVSLGQSLDRISRTRERWAVNMLTYPPMMFWVHTCIAFDAFGMSLMYNQGEDIWLTRWTRAFLGTTRASLVENPFRFFKNICFVVKVFAKSWFWTYAQPVLFVPPTPADSPHRYDLPRFSFKKFSKSDCSEKSDRKWWILRNSLLLPGSVDPSHLSDQGRGNKRTSSSNFSIYRKKVQMLCQKQSFDLNLSVIPALVILPICICCHWGFIFVVRSICCHCLSYSVFLII